MHSADLAYISCNIHHVEDRLSQTLQDINVVGIVNVGIDVYYNIDITHIILICIITSTHLIHTGHFNNFVMAFAVNTVRNAREHNLRLHLNENYLIIGRVRWVNLAGTL